MNAIHFQGLGGASGDMILAALLDLGADVESVNRALASLPMEPVSVRPLPAASHGLRGLRVEVSGVPERAHGRSLEPRGHSHGPHGEPHSHPEADHHHRSFRDIREMILGSSLSPEVRDLSLRVFTRLAEAEGRVHGVPAEDISFHEVGAADSIADIVGACFALRSLGVERVSFDPLPLGSGTVHCAHGLYPVPAPAVVEMLQGIPVAADGEEGERVTPTGAALLTTWRTQDRCPPGRILRSGLGFGQRAWPGRPNVLRAILLDSGEATPEQDTVLCLETHLDDVTPEVLGALVDRLMEAGAWDVALSPILMKKQRPGVRLTVLSDPDLRDPLRMRIFRETGTFGIRETLTQRTRLDRRMETVTTPYGSVRIKVGVQGDEIVVWKPEFEDCRRLADEAGVPIREVLGAAQKAAPDSGVGEDS